MKALSEVTRQRLAPLKLQPSDRLQLTLDKEGKYFIASIYGVRKDGTIGWASTEATSTFPQRIPEKHQIPTHNGVMYRFGATATTVGIIDTTWPREQIIFGDEDDRLAFDYHVLTIAREEKIAENYAKYKLTKEMPEHDLELHPTWPLSPYQQVACHNSMLSEGYGLFMEQGTGKTPTVIARICNSAKKYHAETGKVYSAVVVCPKAVRKNWFDEFEKFSTQCGNVTIIRGGKIRRTKQMIEAMKFDDDTVFTVIIIGYETLAKSWDIVGLWPWMLAVADEGHMFCNPNTVRWDFMQKLRDRSESRMLLTGTPIGNTPLELFTQLEFLKEGASGFIANKQWREFYGVFDNKGGQSQGEGKLVGVQNMPFLQETLSRKSFQITKEEAMPDMPKKLYDRLDCEMTQRQREIYDELAENLAIEIENDMNSAENKSLVINNILVKLLRLNQITSGFISWDPIIDLDSGEVLQPSTVEYFEENPKLDLLIENIKSMPENSKAVVWCCWMPSIDQIAHRLGQEGIKYVLFRGSTSDDERELAKKLFNGDPATKVFLGNQAAGGIGLNLLGYVPEKPDEYKTNADWTFHYAQDWSPRKRWQCEDRNHRRGTRVPIRNTDLCVPGSIDEQIRDRVVKKKQVADKVQDIREILTAVVAGLGEKDD